MLDTDYIVLEVREDPRPPVRPPPAHDTRQNTSSSLACLFLTLMVVYNVVVVIYLIHWVHYVPSLEIF